MRNCHFNSKPGGQSEQPTGGENAEVGFDLPRSAERTNVRPYYWLCLLALCLLSCNKPDPDSLRRAAVTTTINQLQACLRPRTETTQAQLALVSITRTPQAISARLVAYATDKTVDFYLPVYLMSRGRWLINERERAFLLDEHCREFRLQDRKSTNGKPLPLDGKVVLPPGAAFEFNLSFARLPEETHLGALVYGAKVIPFSILPLPTMAEKQADTKPASTTPGPLTASPAPRLAPPAQPD
jgi:hypothetical protein